MSTSVVRGNVANRSLAGLMNFFAEPVKPVLPPLQHQTQRSLGEILGYWPRRNHHARSASPGKFRFGRTCAILARQPITAL